MDSYKNFIKIIEENKNDPKYIFKTMNKILGLRTKIPEINEDIIKRKLLLFINVCINFLEFLEDPNSWKSNKLTTISEESIVKNGNKTIMTLKELFDVIAGKKITSLNPIFYQKITRILLTTSMLNKHKVCGFTILIKYMHELNQTDNPISMAFSIFTLGIL